MPLQTVCRKPREPLVDPTSAFARHSAHGICKGLQYICDCIMAKHQPHACIHATSRSCWHLENGARARQQPHPALAAPLSNCIATALLDSALRLLRFETD